MFLQCSRNQKEKKMKIGVTQIVLSGRSLDEIIDLCQEAGYEAVELTFRDGGALDVNMSEAEIKQVGEKCAAAGIEITSVIASYKERGNMLSPDPEERKKGRKSTVRALEICSLLNAGAILLHPGQLTSQGTYEEAWNGLLTELKELAPIAATYKSAIGLENVWNKFLLSPKEMAEFIDEVGSEWVGTYLDTANMMAYGYPEHWVRSLGKRITRIHLKDFKRGEHQFVNLLDGDTDWPTLMKELRAIGYTGALIHEVGGDHETLVDIAARMRKIVAM